MPTPQAINGDPTWMGWLLAIAGGVILFLVTWGSKDFRDKFNDIFERLREVETLCSKVDVLTERLGSICRDLERLERKINGR